MPRDCLPIFLIFDIFLIDFDYGIIALKVKGINISAPRKVVYADITYLTTKNRHYFLALVVDTHVKY